MSVQIYVHTQNERLTFSCEEGAAVSSLLRENGLLALPCGVGKCGKCLIYASTKPCTEEINLLGSEKIAQGLRLACYTKAKENLEITIPGRNELEVLTQYSAMDYVFDPLVKRRKVTVAEPTLDDQRPDLQRVLDALSLDAYFLNFSKLKSLPYALRADEFNYAAVENGCFINWGKDENSYGLVIDIGTTTVAVCLINTTTGEILASVGEQNAQAPYGADVISRIRSEMEWQSNGCKGENPLFHAITSQIDRLLQQLLHKHNLEDVDFIVFTGNTTMMHMLCGIPGEFISKAPFIPVLQNAQRLHAEELGIHSQAVCYLMPCISSYIGADIVASLLAANAHHPQGPFILIDLGTNAEIVLSYNNKLLSCSAAAGPCFEGATLSCGMAGQKGAIAEVCSDDEKGFTCTTIGEGEAKGICGSGVLDILALLLDKGIVDETGRLEENVPEFAKYLHDDSFYLTDKVYFSQKDIREVQLAKSAVRAGIEILLKEASLSFADINKLYLAGGFGSALRKESAVRIGLIPQELGDKVHVLGNGASFGALRYVTEAHVQEGVKELIQKMQYIELSSHAGFSDAYIENMIFPV